MILIVIIIFVFLRSQMKIRHAAFTLTTRVYMNNGIIFPGKNSSNEINQS